MMDAVEFIDLIERCDYVAEKQLASLRTQLLKKNSNVTPKEIAKLLLEKKHVTKYQAKRLLQLEKQGLPETEDAGAKWKTEDVEEVVEVGLDDLVEVDDLEGLGSLEGFDDPGTDGPFDSSLDDAMSSPLSEEEDPDKNDGKYKKKKVRENQWDSPLLLLGGGGLVMLVMLGGLLFFWLTWDSGDDQFQLAEQDYRGSSYVQAVAKYEKFIKNFPTHPQVDLAKVHMGMATLRNDTEVSKDWEKSLVTANTVLPEIEQLETFDDARPELASLLPDILQGFAERAKKAPTIEEAEHNVSKAKEALKLVNNGSYLPTSQRQTQQTRIDRILADIERVERSISRDTELYNAITEIESKSAEGGFDEIYQIRKKLLQIYPALTDDKMLADAIAKASAQLIGQIKTSNLDLAADLNEVATPSQRMTLASRIMTKEGGSSVAEKTIVLRYNGALFGIDIASGELLWRRFVGFTQGHQPVKVVSADGQMGVISFDSHRMELLRLDASTGKLKWRVAINDQVYQPLLVDDLVILASPSGKLWRIDGQTGKADYFTQLPQKISAGPGETSGLPFVFIPGEHSNIYVISIDDLSCKQIVHVGHEAGTVTVSPIAVLRHLLIFENSGEDIARIHAWKLNAQGKMERAQETMPMPGRILVQPKVFDSRIIVTNNHGAITVLKVDTGSKEAPIANAVTPIKADRENGLFSYATLDRGTLWVADKRLTKYEMLIAKGTLIRKSVDYQGDIFAGPLYSFGNVLVHIREELGKPGAVVSAVSPQLNKIEPLWECYISSPVAGSLFQTKDAGDLMAVSARGSWFKLGEPSTSSSVVNRLVDPDKVTLSEMNYPHQIFISEGKRLFANSEASNEAALFDESRTTGPIRPIRLEIPSKSQVAPPVTIQDMILVPSNTGQVFCLDPLTGNEKAHPYQPPLSFNTEINWGQPAVFGASGNEVVVSNGSDKLYHLELKKEPEPLLALKEEIVLEQPISSSLAVSGLLMAAVQVSGFEDELLLFQLPGFEVQKSFKLEGRAYLGPIVSDGRFIIATDKEGIVTVGDDLEIAWTLPTNNGKLTGMPLSDAGNYIFSLDDGQVIKVNQTTGEVIDSVHLHEPLIAGISKYQDKFIVNGYDGTLHVVQLK